MRNANMLTSCLLLLTFWSELSTQQQPDPHLETVKQWNLLTYNFPWDWPVNDETLNNPKQTVTTGIEVGKNRIFLATPRLFSGVPATLSVVAKDSFGDSPVLEAYPDWSYHAAGVKAYNCSDLGLVSVYRMKIDSCNRLWALDSGVSRSLEDFEVTCPPKILVFDLNTDRVVRRIDFPPEVVRNETLFTNIVIDETSSRSKYYCDDVFAYITDTVMPAIVVYDSSRDLTWRISHPAMYPDPGFSKQQILEDSYELMDGIVGIALDEATKTVYFQPFATDRLFSVPVEALRAGPVPNGKELPVRLVGKKSSQGIGLAVSPRGSNIFFSPFTEIAVAKWNSRSNSQQVLALDPERLQFVADMRTTDNDPGSLWILSSRFQRFFLKNLKPEEVNTHILRIRGVVERRHQPVAMQPHRGGYANFYYNTPAPPQRYEPIAALYPAYQQHQVTQRPIIKPVSYSTYVGPYDYENVALVNQFMNNPFVQLNMGEKPLLDQLRPHYGGLTGEVYYPKPQINFDDFNGLRVAKSVKNLTATHL